MGVSADVVIVGAGIVGVSAAYHLTVRHGVGQVVLVDPRPPLTLTSDKSTECYRNWWPDRPMVGLMNRSIDIFEELAAETDFGLNRNGYLFVTGSEETMSALNGQVAAVSELGASAEVLGPGQLRERFPYVTDRAAGAVRVDRAGWFRAQDLGQWQLTQARDAGARLIAGQVVAIGDGRVGLADGTEISTSAIVVAAGPLSRDVARSAGIELPLFSELHLKVAFKDHLRVIPRDAPMTIWSDTQRIVWSEEEREGLEAMGRQDLLGDMPIYCHFRPEGGKDSPYFVALWEYHGQVVEPTWPLPEDDLYPEVVMRGLTTMVPGLAAYTERLPESFVDGGYYTKTRENRPLIGPSGVAGIHLLTGMSGFGVMVSAGAADLLARHLTNSNLPDYADAFLLSRYDDPEYTAGLDRVSSGQL
ncbi:MAG TPA: FAD-dependent oxidoreductase [Acidimicrobiia bacterium]|nr:FAD-dependent oxidoreductase [Acidimicrobiia bacterium]